MEADFDFTIVGTALLVLGLAYLFSGLVFLLPNPAEPSDDSSTPLGQAVGRERDEERANEIR
jgi:hypothetical protein